MRIGGAVCDTDESRAGSPVHLFLLLGVAKIARRVPTLPQKVLEKLVLIVERPSIALANTLNQADERVALRAGTPEDVYDVAVHGFTCFGFRNHEWPLARDSRTRASQRRHGVRSLWNAHLPRVRIAPRCAGHFAYLMTSSPLLTQTLAPLGPALRSVHVTTPPPVAPTYLPLTP